MSATDGAIQSMDPDSHLPRRVMLVLTVLIVVGLAAFVASVSGAVKTQHTLSGSAQAAALAGARNNVELIEHRKRQEEAHECLAVYIHDLVKALMAHQDPDSVPVCHAENLDGLEVQLADARKRLAELDPNDPALTSHTDHP